MAGKAQLDTLEAKGLIRLAAIRPELELSLIHISEPTRPY